DLVDVDRFAAAVALGDAHGLRMMRRGQREAVAPGRIGRGGGGMEGRVAGCFAGGNAMWQFERLHDVTPEAEPPRDTAWSTGRRLLNSNSCSRAQGLGLGFHGTHRAGHTHPAATRLPAEAVTRIGQLVQHRSRASQNPRPDWRVQVASTTRAPGPMCRQVFGLCGRGSFDPPTLLRLPGCCDPVRVEAFVSAYRCGAVPDLHRIPFQTQMTVVSVWVPTRTTYGGFGFSSTQNVEFGLGWGFALGGPRLIGHSLPPCGGVSRPAGARSFSLRAQRKRNQKKGHPRPALAGLRPASAFREIGRA